MKINRIYLEKFKKYKYGYMYMIKRGVFLLFDSDTLEYKGLFTLYPYIEDKDYLNTVDKLIALDFLEI